MQPSQETTIEAKLGIDGGSPRPRRRLLWTALALIPVLAAALWHINGKGPDIVYTTRPAVRGDLVVTVTATGSLAATNAVEVGSELSGIIQTVEVDYNDPVRKGQPLARLDDTKFKAAVMKARAALASARAKLDQAEATRAEKQKLLARYRKSRRLTSGKTPSMEVLEAAEAALARAVADVAVARAAVDEADAEWVERETDLAKTVIVSPIDGIVLDRNVDPGQTVAASFQAPVLFTIAEDLARMELQVDVDEADVGQVQAGQAVEFSVDAYPDRTFQARIIQVRYGAQTTDGVVTYTTVIAVDNADRLLRPGMTATAEIIVETLKDVLLVPNQALRFAPPREKPSGRRGWISALLPRPPRPSKQPRTPGAAGGQQRVWVLKEGRPVPIPVVTSATNGAETAVTGSPLQPGQALVVGASEVTS